MTKLPIFAAFAAAMLAAPALAAEATTTATAAAPAPTFSVAATPIGTLLDTPATRAVLDKELPGFTTNPQVEMARGMSLKAVQSYAPEKLTDERLAAVDAELAKLPKQ